MGKKFGKSFGFLMALHGKTIDITQQKWVRVWAMKTAMYLRVSTEKQTVEPQRLELREYATRKGWGEPEEFEDTISGGKTSREGLDRLMGAVIERRFEAVLVVKLDRLGRSLQHVAQLIGVFEKAGVALVIPGQNIDTTKTNPAGKLQMHVLMAVAEFERAIIAERTKAGLEAARARGVVLGRTNPNIPVNWREIVKAWRLEEERNYRDLAKRLGGVAASSAWRMEKRLEAEEAK